MKNQPLWQEYRPKTYAEVVAQDKAIEVLARLRKRSLYGRAYWISGKSGTGKTTIARILAAELADPYCITAVSGNQVNAEFLREMESGLQYRGFGRGGKVWIVDEAHLLRAPMVSRLLTILEDLPDFAAVIFTTTRQGEDRLFEENIDAGPFASRCVDLALAQRDLIKPLAARAREIAVDAGIDGKPIERYEKLLREKRSNMRHALEAIEEGAF